MTHLPDIILDLGLILMAAAVVILICKRLNQPVVLGYLIAGFIVGPNFEFFFTVKDSAAISIWAEIGVIFMLFGLGLEFSFKKLTKVGKSASITALVEVLFMLGAGYLVGQLMNWSKMDSIFLGGILSVSSTTIIVKAFDELGLKGRSFVSLVFGVLIVEDLIAILLLVFLSSIAVTQSLSGTELVYSSLRLGFFIAIWFLLGIYLLPIFVRKCRNLLNDETMLIVSIGLCLMMVITANYFGFSPALGAFVMGSILSETSKGHHIEKLLLPVKDLFSAVFFVSVGMLIDFKILSQYFGVIVLLTLLTIIGKFFSSAIGAIISGRNIKHSVQAGMSLAQIGEFSFIIATLGMTLKVTSDLLYPIAVAVSAVTTFTTPYLIKYSDQFSDWLDKRLPAQFKKSLSRYEVAMSTSSGGHVFSLIVKEFSLKIILNSVLVVAITLVATRVALPVLNGYFGHNGFVNFASCVITLVVAAPFLWAIFIGAPGNVKKYSTKTIEQLKRLQIGISSMRFIVSCILAGYIVSQFTSIQAFSGILLAVLAFFGIFFLSRFSGSFYMKIEKRFIDNLNANNNQDSSMNSQFPELAPWNATLAQFVISPNSPLITKTLDTSGIKEKFGITVAMIQRGSKSILAPTRHDLLLPFDKLFLIGTEEQLISVRETVEAKSLDEPDPISSSFGLTYMVLTDADSFVGKTIRDCGLREIVQGLVVGIERNGKRHLSPDSSMVLQSGDLLWLVGDKTVVRTLRSQKEQ